ncbi:hypothetical protein [Desulfoplanes formicivorans]|nr:hypothetical protein [Desulfoplanes formicivorans]
MTLKCKSNTAFSPKAARVSRMKSDHAFANAALDATNHPRPARCIP